MLQLRYRRIKICSNFDKKRKIITLLTGQFILDSDKRHNHYFRYNINTRLRLNIKFEIIYFSIGSQNCDFEALKIYKVGKTHALFIFCGHHSPFNFYPKFTKVLMKFETWMQIPFALNFIFTVMDQYIVHSISNIHFAGQLPNLVYKIGHKTLVLLFFIQVKKISCVVFYYVHNLVSKFIIYDGPGFTAKFIIVNSTMSEIISTSTFQCFIQIPMYAVTIKQLGSLNYTS